MFKPNTTYTCIAYKSKSNGSNQNLYKSIRDSNQMIINCRK